MKNKIKRKLKNAVRKATQKVASQRLLRPIAVGVYDPSPGTSIEVAAAEAIAQAKKQRCPVRFNFNGVKLVATAKKSPTTIVWEFHQILAQMSDKYRHSKKGIAADAKRDKEVADSQRQINLAFNALPELLLQPEPDRLGAVLHWLCDNQSAMDDIGIHFSHTDLVTLLERAGYQNNAQVGRRPETFTRQAMGEYIVGQAINCLKSGLGPHQITHKFAEEYFNWTDEKEAQALKAIADETIAKDIQNVLANAPHEPRGTATL